MHSYPTAAALADLLSAGGTPPASTLLEATMRAAIRGFEETCQRKMLAGMTITNQFETPYSRTYYGADVAAGPDGQVWLPLGAFGDLARVDSVVYSPSDSSGQDETLTLTSDFIPAPENNPQRGWPYTRLRLRRFAPFLGGVWSDLVGSHFTVTGLWGFPELPDDAWLAMLHGAALLHFEGSWAGVKAGALPVKSWTGPGGVSTTFDTAWYAGRRAGWAESLAGALGRYRRVAIA